MTKLVVSPTLRIKKSKDDKTFFDTSGPGIRWDRPAMERLLWGCWWALLQLGELSEYVEVIKVHFERNGHESREAITDVAFEVVIVGPETKAKMVKVIFRCAPETLRREDGAEVVGSCLLDSIRTDIAYGMCKMAAKANHLTDLIESLGIVLKENRAKIRQ